MSTDTLAFAFSSISASMDIVRAIAAAPTAIERAELKLKLADVMSDLAEAKMLLTDAIQQRSLLQAQIASLEESLRNKDTVMRKFDAYYSLNEKGEATGDPYCQRCWEKDHKLFHLATPSPGERRSTCPVCKATYSYDYAPPLQ